MYHFSENIPSQELPGVTKKSFAMAFGGGEIWFEHLDGMYDYKELVLNKLENDSKTFLRPSYPSLIAVNLDETVVDSEIMQALAQKLTGICRKFTRVVIVGMERRKQKIFKKFLTSNNADFALKFIDDFEKAKLWLVSEKP